MKSKSKQKKLLKGKKTEENGINLPYLPDHIISDILIRVPAAHLYCVFRLVCKPWQNLIGSSSFVAQNIFHNKTQVFVAFPSSSKMKYYKTRVLEMDDNTLDFKLRNVPLARLGLIRSSCKGLVLVNAPRSPGVLHIMNLLTKSHLTLPKCPSGCPHESCGAAIGFDPCTQEYKVVHMYSDGFGYKIFNLGRSYNSWRIISGPFKEPHERPFDVYDFCWTDPVSINNQVLHWSVDSDRFVISMDVTHEKSRKTNLPDIGEIYKARYEMLDMGGRLGFVYKVSYDQIDIWVLEDYHQQIWIKRHSISMESLTYTISKVGYSYSDDYTKFPKFMHLFAAAALREGDVIIFKHMSSKYTSNCVYLCDIKKREMKKLKVRIKSDTQFIPHRESLVCWTDELLFPTRLPNFAPS